MSGSVPPLAPHSKHHALCRLNLIGRVFLALKCTRASAPTVPNADAHPYTAAREPFSSCREGGVRSEQICWSIKAAASSCRWWCCGLKGPGDDSQQSTAQMMHPCWQQASVPRSRSEWTPMSRTDASCTWSRNFPKLNATTLASFLPSSYTHEDCNLQF